MQSKWQGLLAIECPDKYARILANGIIKNSHNAAKTVIKCNRNYCVNICTVYNLFSECM